MLPKYEYGDRVRVVRNVRNDGTFPGLGTGNLLVRRGSVGFVMNIGTFLQDQLIYTVNFLDQGRIVGCREEELQAESEPWVESRFETREKVRSRATIQVNGEILAEAGAVGEVLKVLRDTTDAVARYHVYFPGHTLQVPEGLLEPLTEHATEA